MSKVDITVLYVEDESLFRSVHSEFLSDMVTHHYTAVNGQQGLEFYKKYRPDLVITDIAMPLMNGLRMVKLIKEFDSEARTIVTTSYSETEYFLEAIELGVDRFILKPFDRKNFQHMISDISTSILHKKGVKEEEFKRRQAEEALRESEERFRTFYNYAPDSVLLFHPISQRVEDFNQTAIEMLGYSREEIMKLSYSDLVFLEEDPTIASIRNNIMDKESISKQYFILASDGRKIPVEAKEKRFVHRGVELLLGFYNDISERVKAEKSIKEYQGKLELLVDERTNQLKKTNIKLLEEISVRQQAENKLLARAKIDAVVSIISSKFVSVTHENIEQEILDALRQIATITESKRAVVLILNSNDFSIDKQFVWYQKNHKPKQSIRSDFQLLKELPIWGCLHNHEHILVRDTYSDSIIKNLPLFLINEVESFLILPLFYDGVLHGIIGIDSSKSDDAYSENVMFLLNMSGHVFLNAMARVEVGIELLFSEKKAKALLNANADSMILLSNNGKILEYNEKAYEILGKISKDIINADYLSFFPDELKQQRIELMKNVIESGEKKHMNDVFQGRKYEHTFYPVINEDGKSTRLAIMSHDVTEQVQSQQLIQNQFQFLQSLMNSIPSPVYYTDVDGILLGCNNEFLKATDTVIDNILKKSVYQIAQMNPSEIHTEKDQILLKSDLIQRYEVPVIYPDGLQHDLLFYKSTFRNIHNNNAGIICIMIDISELKKYQTELHELNLHLEQRVYDELKKTKQQQQLLIQKSKLESLGKLAAGIAHEVNQPLGGISMGLENILFKWSRKELEDTYFREKLSHLFENINRIKLIIDHIRTFSRDQQNTVFEKVSVNEAVTNAVQLVENQYKAHHIKLDVRISTEILYFIGNKYKLEQVILNLLSNAKDAVEEKKKNNPDFDPQIIIYTRHIGPYHFVEVEDNGNGIHPDIREFIFEPFFTTKEISVGTGLGLSIVYGIVNELKGRIDFKTELGKYTRFIVRLPAFDV